MIFKQEKTNILTEMLVNDFGWDELTASSIWAFGPINTGSNMLLDYTIEDEVDKKLLYTCRNSIVQGF